MDIITLRIHGKNDSSEEFQDEAQWITKELGKDMPLHFTAFHPGYKLTDAPPTQP